MNYFVYAYENEKLAKLECVDKEEMKLTYFQYAFNQLEKSNVSISLSSSLSWQLFTWSNNNIHCRLITYTEFDLSNWPSFQMPFTQ